MIMDNANSAAWTKTKKRVSSYFYTYGKFGRRVREIVDADNPFLYSPCIPCLSDNGKIMILV